MLGMKKIKFQSLLLTTFVLLIVVCYVSILYRAHFGSDMLVHIQDELPTSYTLADLTLVKRLANFVIHLIF